MYEFRYWISKIKSRLFGNDEEIINNYFRKYGMKIGKGTKLYSNIMTPEPYLIHIGNNVTVSNDVQFITHDNSICKVMPDMTDLFGRITIGDNCFIGARCALLYGIELKKNTIVAVGSVVTKSFNDSNIIIGGNPAKIIGRWESFAEKGKEFALNIDNLSNKEKKDVIFGTNKLIKR